MQITFLLNKGDVVKWNKYKYSGNFTVQAGPDAHDRYVIRGHNFAVFTVPRDELTDLNSYKYIVGSGGGGGSSGRKLGASPALGAPYDPSTQMNIQDAMVELAKENFKNPCREIFLDKPEFQSIGRSERCNHDWKEYHGFTHSDLYCTKCSARKEIA